jgi:hypothetical protein
MMLPSRSFSACSFGVFPGIASHALKDAPEISRLTSGAFITTVKLMKAEYPAGRSWL